MTTDANTPITLNLTLPAWAWCYVAQALGNLTEVPEGEEPDASIVAACGQVDNATSNVAYEDRPR